MQNKLFDGLSIINIVEHLPELFIFFVRQFSQVLMHRFLQLDISLLGDVESGIDTGLQGISTQEGRT